MKILHIIGFMGTGGVESFLLNLIKKQSEIHDVSLLTILDKNTYLADDVFPESKNKYIQLNFASIINPLIILRIRNEVKKIKPDVVHVHLFPAQLIVPIALLRLDCKVLTTEHGISHRRIKYPLFHSFEWLGFYLYSRIVGVAEPVSKSLADEYPQFESKIVTINNGIDINAVYSALAVPKSSISSLITDDDILICMVGRLEVGKDYETLIEAMQFLPKKFKLLIVGEGCKRKLLEDKVINCGLANRVVFYGFKRNIYFIYKSIDVFVLSSEREGLPMVLLEAMAARKPCIGSSVDGIKNILEWKDILFTYGNAFELAEKIKGVYSAVEFYSNFSAEKIQDYSFEQMFLSYERLYSDILSD